MTTDRVRGMEIEVTSHVTHIGGHCAHRNCARRIVWQVRATANNGTSACTFACSKHLRRQESHALRMLALAHESSAAA